MSTKPISNYLAAPLLLLDAALVGANWYQQPHRAIFWSVEIIFIACMVVVLLLISRRSTSQAYAIRRGIIFAGLLLVIPLSLELATALGAIHHADFSKRAIMAIIGAFLMVNGNAVPKTLTPLSALRCDAAKAQAFYRFAGWTWVLTGLALTITWLALPLHLADSMTFVVLPAGMLIIGAQLVRLRWSRHSVATGNGSV
jgi:hypothetical protein